MIKKGCFLAATLLLAACSSIVSSNQVQVSTSPSLTSNNSTSSVLKTESSVAVVEVQCNGEIPASLKAKLGKYRLAQKSDFVAAIRGYEKENPKDKLTCSSFTADFNKDGFKDYSLLLVAQDNTTFHFTVLINQGDDSFIPRVTKTFKSITKPEAGVIYTSMSFKPANRSGSALRDYFPLKPGTPERKIFEANPAIELWKTLDTDLAGVPQNLELSSLGYCTDNFSFVDGDKTTIVCD